MKNKSLIFSTLSILAVSCAALFFNSCSKDNSVEQNMSVNLEEEFGKYTKEVTIYDKDKQNSAVLLVGSDDEAILNMWSSENFSLITLKEGENIEDVLGEDALKSSFGEEDSEEPTSDDVVASISTRFIMKNLKDDVVKVALQSNSPYDEDMRGWKTDTHYSDFYGEPGSQNTRGIVSYEVSGHNFWHRGYWAMHMLKEKSSIRWSTIQSEWAKISKGQVEKDDRACYVMKGSRKYKGKNNNSVLIKFEY